MSTMVWICDNGVVSLVGVLMGLAATPDGSCLIVEDFKQGVKLGDPEQIKNATGYSHQLYAAAACSSGVVAFHDDAQSSAIEVRNFRHVEQEVAFTLPHQLLCRFQEPLRTVSDDDFPGQIDDGYRARFTVINFE